MTTVQLNGLFCLPRIIYAMAVDGLFFEAFAYVHPRTQVPLLGILVFGALTAVVTLLLDIEALVQFLSIGTLLAYTFVAISVLVLRFQTASQSGSPSLAGSSLRAKEYSSFSDHLELVGAGHGPEPGRLRPALRPYLGFLDRGSPGAAVRRAICGLVVSAVALGCVLMLGHSVLHLPLWGFLLLLLCSGVTFLLSLLVLGAHQQQCLKDTFQVNPRRPPYPLSACHPASSAGHVPMSAGGPQAPEPPEAETGLEACRSGPWACGPLQPAQPCPCPPDAPGAPDSSSEHRPQLLPDAEAELPDLAALHHLAADG